MPEQKDRGSWD